MSGALIRAFWKSVAKVWTSRSSVIADSTSSSIAVAKFDHSTPLHFHLGAPLKIHSWCWTESQIVIAMGRWSELPMASVVFHSYLFCHVRPQMETSGALLPSEAVLVDGVWVGGRGGCGGRVVDC